MEGCRLGFAPEGIAAQAAHALLRSACWCAGMALATLERALRHLLCIALRADGAGQVGFALMTTPERGMNIGKPGIYLRQP